MTPRFFLTPVAALLLAANLLSAAAASAQVVFTVDSTLDQIDDDTTDGECLTATGTCTLRAAFMQASKIGDPGATIAIPAGIYTLTRAASVPNGPPEDGDLNLTTPAGGSPLIHVRGESERTTIIDGNGLDRVLSVGPGRQAFLENLTLRNGSVGPQGGGGISSEGTLYLFHCTVSGNRALGFGAGGGILSFGLGGLYLDASSVIGNQASGPGGGILSKTPVSMKGSTIDGNSAGFPGGGGLWLENGLTSSNSTISRNVSGARGGGMYRNLPGLATLVNTTIAGNRAVTEGGGVYHAVSGTYYYSSTVVGNDSSYAGVGGRGGGLYVADTKVASLSNTLVAGNTFQEAAFDDCHGTLLSHRSNRFGEVSDCTIYVPDGDGWELLNGTAFLGPLTRNGGPTETVALLPGSNAIDAGDSTLGCTGSIDEVLSIDQRNVPRALGARCDVGAYEEGFLFFDSFESGDISAW